ncbi:Maf family nucleotide pyrophosphatase [Castellaniella sp.]|jgi:septum formation protein|uniref:Maf family nucleotide pyrophosphatase n=1 Tax=Castellaniella sp. TaxID=1955812 RepID=UPI002D7E5469|nr:Maf family nucleotide pyrophosphatase [Castellaniella sp.]HET8704490.1 Maf family nucleotide pyrophosphatase [Castellaniella sp.]
MPLILASSSPYRRALLQRLNLPFSVQSPDIDESPLPGETPLDLSLRLAREKAAAIAARNPGALVIGSDQVAAFQGEPVGKPGSFEAAREQLRRFGGHDVLFHTALCVTDGQRHLLEHVSTECRFLALDDARIEHYLRVEQPYDTAGSAKAECLGVALMERMRSDDPTALIGLPLIALCRMLRAFGLEPLGAHTGNGQP